MSIVSSSKATFLAFSQEYQRSVRACLIARIVARTWWSALVPTVAWLNMQRGGQSVASRSRWVSHVLVALLGFVLSVSSFAPLSLMIFRRDPIALLATGPPQAMQILE